MIKKSQLINSISNIKQILVNNVNISNINSND